MRVITPEKLQTLKQAAVALADGQGCWEDGQAVATRLAHHKLTAGTLFQSYAEAPVRHRERDPVKRGDGDYQAALDAVVEILQDRARNGLPLTYGELSAMLISAQHQVSAYQGPLPFLLEDASVQESQGGRRPLISALVVLQDEKRPSAGFYKLAKRDPYLRKGDDTTI
ncbi:hypothetical protein [Streptomyces sp. NPDC005283]|uniref:hypothetical protein n=1 Tax=Streptomyces sp. NPDC005283 TaxID=3156871 RepID=UPI0034554387